MPWPTLVEELVAAKLVFDGVLHGELSVARVEEYMRNRKSSRFKARHQHALSNVSLL